MNLHGIKSNQKVCLCHLGENPVRQPFCFMDMEFWSEHAS
jgi:hypothetical protein